MNIVLSRPFTKYNAQIYRKIVKEIAPFSGAYVTRKGFSSSGEQFKHQTSFFSTSSIQKASLSDKIKHDLSLVKNVDLGQLKSAPVPAILYGSGGIIPFVFPPLSFIVGSYSPFLATAQLMYGATILAFVGGVKWGNALAKSDISHEQIGISTIPSLIAWVSLLVPEPLGFLVVSSGLIGALYVDLKSSNYPPWFNAMRLTLTSVASVSLLTTFLFNIFH